MLLVALLVLHLFFSLLLRGVLHTESPVIPGVGASWSLSVYDSLSA